MILEYASDELTDMIPNSTGYQLKVVGITFTNLCNLNCIHCYNSSGPEAVREDRLSLEEWKRVVKDIKAMGCNSVNFGGGECALHKDFISLCQYMREESLEISLTTNGTQLHEIRDHLDLFSDVGVSIDFAEPSLHNQTRGRIGIDRQVFQQACETIRYLVDHGENTEIVTCLSGLNCHTEELKRIYELCIELEVNFWRINRFKPTGRGRVHQELSLNPSELQGACSYLSSIRGNCCHAAEPVYNALKGGIYFNSHCPCGFSGLRITSNGDVIPCVYLNCAGGNVRKQSLEEIYNNSTVFRNIRNRNLEGTKCASCPNLSLCNGGCAGAAYLEYGDFNHPDPLCWWNGKSDYEFPKPQRIVAQHPNVHEDYLCTFYIPIRDS